MMPQSILFASIKTKLIFYTQGFQNDNFRETVLTLFYNLSPSSSTLQVSRELRQRAGLVVD